MLPYPSMAVGCVSSSFAYCSRSDVIGSIRAARYAGTPLAAMLTSRNTPAVTAKVRGSVGRIPYSIPERSRVATVAIAMPATTPMRANEREAALDNHAQDVGSLGAKSHAQPDLKRALRDHVRQKAVEPD